MRRLNSQGLQIISDALSGMQDRRERSRMEQTAQTEAQQRAQQTYLASIMKDMPYERLRALLGANPGASGGLQLPEFEMSPEEKLARLRGEDSLTRFPTLAPEIRNAGTYESAYGKPIPKEALEQDIKRQNLPAPEFAEANRIMGGIQMKPQEAAEETRLGPLTAAQTVKEKAETAFTMGPKTFQSRAAGTASLANAAESGARVPLIQEQTQNTILQRDPKSAVSPGYVKQPSVGAAGAGDARKTEQNARILQTVDDLVGRVGNDTVGIGAWLAKIPATDAANFRADLDTLEANIAFGELQEMRNASKTGGALGQVSDRELRLLGSSMAGLRTDQSVANFKKNLQKIRDSLARWNAAKGGGTAAPNAAGKTSAADSYLKKHGY